MKNLYDNQNFWIGQVNKAKHIGIPNHCVWTGDWNRIVTNRITIINKFIPIHESIFDWVVSSCVKHGIVECEELGEIESGRWNQIEEELLRIAKKGIIWPSYSNEYEFIER